MAQGGVLAIKIGWVCDLDRGGERCLPHYSFTRLDGLSLATGYNFRYGTGQRRSTQVPHVCAMALSPRRHARYHHCHDGPERRTLTKAFGIRFDVLVYGHVRVGLGRPQGGLRVVGCPPPMGSLNPQAGKFGIIPTLINTVAAFTSIGVVSCGRSQPLRGSISLGGGGIPPMPNRGLGRGPEHPRGVGQSGSDVP